MGCSSGMVSSLTSMRGGWKVCTMDRGRELLRFLPLGLFVMGESIGDEGWIGEDGRIGVELRCGFTARRGLGASLEGDGLGDESLVLCPENWDINDKTVVIISEPSASMKKEDYTRQGGITARGCSQIPDWERIR